MRDLDNAVSSRSRSALSTVLPDAYFRRCQVNAMVGRHEPGWKFLRAVRYRKHRMCNDMYQVLHAPGHDSGDLRERFCVTVCNGASRRKNAAAASYKAAR